MHITAWEFIKGIGATILGSIGWFLGGFDGLLIALIVFMVIDIAMGVMVAYNNKNLDSKTSYQGLRKKAGVLLLVGLTSILDMYVLQSNAPVRETVISFYLFNEGLSITENAAKLGLPIPKKIIDVLAQLKGEEDKG